MPDEQSRRRRKLSAIMMADVSGFSRMMGANEDSTVDLINEFHRHVTLLVEQFEGRVVGTAGDSVFGEFDSVVNAVRCARRIQEEQAALNAGRAAGERIETRIGVHLGDVIVEDYRVYGDGVNIAARLEPLADPGGICMSEAVYHQIRNKLDLPVEDVGLRELKNIEYPIHVYKVPPLPLPSGERGARGGDSERGARRGSEGRDASQPTRNSNHTHAQRPHVVERAVARAPRSWLVDLGSTGTLILMIVGVALLLSPIVLFPTGGVLPTAGAILASVGVGRAWAARSRRGRDFLIALGVGLASGAIWTDWSRVTNVLFVVAGLIVAGIGVGSRRRDDARG